MAQFEGSYSQQPAAKSTTGLEMNGWAVGFTLFASVMMILLGMFHFIAGLAAVVDDSFYTVAPNYALSIDVTTWGWLQMVGGIVVMLTSAWLITGNTLARIIAVAVAIISAIANFYSIPYYPVWSILLIALDMGVIWGVCVYGRYMKDIAV